MVQVVQVHFVAVWVEKQVQKEVEEVREDHWARSGHHQVSSLELDVDSHGCAWRIRLDVHIPLNGDGKSLGPIHFVSFADQAVADPSTQFRFWVEFPQFLLQDPTLCAKMR